MRKGEAQTRGTVTLLPYLGVGTLSIWEVEAGGSELSDKLQGEAPLHCEPEAGLGRPCPKQEKEGERREEEEEQEKGEEEKGGGRDSNASPFTGHLKFRKEIMGFREGKSFIRVTQQRAAFRRTL